MFSNFTTGFYGFSTGYDGFSTGSLGFRQLDVYFVQKKTKKINVAPWKAIDGSLVSTGSFAGWHGCGSKLKLKTKHFDVQRYFVQLPPHPDQELVYYFIARNQKLVEGCVPSTHEEFGGSDSSVNNWKRSPAQQSPGQRSLGESCRTGLPEEHVQGGLAVPELNGQVHGRDPLAHVQTAACSPLMVGLVLVSRNSNPIKWGLHLFRLNGQWKHTYLKKGNAIWILKHV